MFYLQKKTAYADAGTRCPGCSSQVHDVRYEVRGDDNTRNVYRCSECSLLFYRPLFDAEPVAMDSVEDADLYGSEVLKRLHEKLIIEKEIRTVRKILCKDRFSLLDVGCGTGWISSIWKHHGADVTGLEASMVRAAVTEELFGIPVFCGMVEDFQSDKKFDVVILRHVVEHLETPFDVLAKLYDSLADGGIMLIIVPNIDCLGRYIFGTNWTWVLPWHCNFFNPKSLRRLIQRTGLTVSREYQTPSPLWYPESLFRLLPENNDTLRDRFYAKLGLMSLVPFAPVVLAGLAVGLGDNITLFARKCSAGSPY